MNSNLKSITTLLQIISAELGLIAGLIFGYILFH